MLCSFNSSSWKLRDAAQSMVYIAICHAQPHTHAHARTHPHTHTRSYHHSEISSPSSLRLEVGLTSAVPSFCHTIFSVFFASPFFLSVSVRAMRQDMASRSLLVLWMKKMPAWRRRTHAVGLTSVSWRRVTLTRLTLLKWHWRRNRSVMMACLW